MYRSADSFLADHGVGTAACAATQEARQQSARASTILRLLASSAGFKGLGLVPNGLFDYPQLRDLDNNPIRRKVRLGNSSAGLRIRHKPLTVVDQPADIQFIPPISRHADGGSR